MKSVLVVGFGITGLSAAKYFVDQGFQIYILDQKPLALFEKDEYKDFFEQDGWQFLGDDIDALLWDAIDFAVVSPGFDKNHRFIDVIKSHGIAIKTDLDFFLAGIDIPVLAITGSNGKTTACQMSKMILQKQGYRTVIVGNIGVTMFDELKKIRQGDFDWVVLELSSFQLAWANFDGAEVFCGVVLNVYENHLDWHGDFHNYWSSKQRLLRFSQKRFLGDIDQTLPPSDLHDVSYLRSDLFLSEEQKKLLLQNDIDMYLWHGLYCCYQIFSDLLGLNFKDIVAALKTFKQDDHRLMPVVSADSLKGRWYNDSKSTNLASSVFAIKHLYAKYGVQIVWINGGMDKQQSLKMHDFPFHAIKFVASFGSGAERYSKITRGRVDSLVFDGLSEAVHAIHQKIDDADVVLFSPAGGSFDAFSDYKHRGVVFSSLLKAIHR